MGRMINNVKDSLKTLKWYEWVMASIMVVIAGYSMALAFMNPSASSNPGWLTIINFVSAICGVVCIFLCAKASISNFIFGIVNTMVYIVYLAYWNIYGTLALEIVVYMPMNILGWIAWAKHRDEGITYITKTKRLNWWQNAIVAVIIVVCGIGYHAILEKLGGNVAWLDAFTLSIGIVAVILETLRYSEQYIWWIITDIIAVAMYIVHFDPVYLTKKSIYLIMAIIGLINWIKLNKTRNTENK